MMNSARVAKALGVALLAFFALALYLKARHPSLFLPHHRSISPAHSLSLRELRRHAAKVNMVQTPDKVKDEGHLVMKDNEASGHSGDSHTAQKKESFSPEFLDEVEKDMAVRRNQISKTCARLGYGNSTNSEAPRHTFRAPRALISQRKAAVYCPVEKTASTFFRRYVYQLEHTDPMRSPFEVPVKMIYACHTLYDTVESHAEKLRLKRNQQKRKLDRIRRRQKRHKKKMTPYADEELGETIDNFLHRSTNFLFVRDPFSRLFSAYVDKLLAPNPEFWSSWGLFAIQKHRQDPTEKSQRCGNDVTFSEFLRFVLDLDLTLPNADPHVRPIFELCRPCDIDYSVIGFMNTFQRDVVYLSNLLNVTETQLEMDKMAADTLRDALEDSVMGAFTEWSHRLAQCVSKGDIVRRIWRKLQIRGFISARINFSPKMLRESVEYLDADDFIKILAKAVAESTDKAELKRQKTAALVSAYRTVDLDILKRIVHLYAADFRGFGFNQRPKFLFDRPGGKVKNSSAALNYMAEWVV